MWSRHRLQILCGNAYSGIQYHHSIGVNINRDFSIRPRLKCIADQIGQGNLKQGARNSQLRLRLDNEVDFYGFAGDEVAILLDETPVP